MDGMVHSPHYEYLLITIHPDKFPKKSRATGVRVRVEVKDEVEPFCRSWAKVDTALTISPPSPLSPASR